MVDDLDYDGYPNRPLKIALLCDFHLGSAGTIIDHIEGIKRLSKHEITVINFRGNIPRSYDLNKFDGVIIHYTLVACIDSYLSPESRIRIRKFRGIKAAFVQDDYRFINATVRAMRAMRLHLLFVLAPSDIIDEVYSPAELPGVRTETVLAGYVPENLLEVEVPPLSERGIDVGYRARKLPAWLGSHGQEKWRIADKFEADARRFGLRTDISCRESDRIYGAKWIEFLTNCKAVLGTESGSGICDFTGEIQTRVEDHVARDPGVPFEVLRELYFKNEDGRLMMNVISPRCFEAAALRTLMVLYEGNYSGRLIPWRHYVPLSKDHSNMEEVVAVLRDHKRCQEIIDQAYAEVALNPENWFKSMVEQMDRAIGEAFAANKIELTKHKDAEVLRNINQDTEAGRGESIKYLLLVNAVRIVDAALLLVPARNRPMARARIKSMYYGALRMQRKCINGLRITKYLAMLYCDRRARRMLACRWTPRYIEDVVFLYQSLQRVRAIGDIDIGLYYDEASRRIVIGASDEGVAPDEKNWGDLIAAEQVTGVLGRKDISSIQLVWHPALACLFDRSFDGNCRELKGLCAAVRETPIAMLGELKAFLGLGRDGEGYGGVQVSRVGVTVE